MPDIDISASGVLQLLTKINLSKAAGPDAIKPVGLKELVHEIAPAVSAVFQLSLDTGTNPQDWKTAFVSPIYKKGDKGNPANYRLTDVHLMQNFRTHHSIRSNQASGKTQFTV